MMRTRGNMAAAVLIIAVAAAGCAKKEKKAPEAKDQGDDEATSAARPSRTPPSRTPPSRTPTRPEARAEKKDAMKVAATVPFQKVTDAKMGYEILVPKGAKILQKVDIAHTYSYPFPGGMHEYNIHITQQDFKNIGPLLKMATMIKGVMLEKKTLPDGSYYLVYKGALTTSCWVYRKAKKGALVVQVSGPHLVLGRIKELCQSFKVTR